MVNTLCPNNICMSAQQMKKFLDFIFGSDLDFYEEYLMDLTDEEQERFFDANPDFMSDFPVKRDKMYLLKDRVFRGILRRVKEYEDKHKRNL